MNERNGEYSEIERLLKQARLPEPSSQLRDRVTEAAKQAWKKEPGNVPWQIPLWRLTLSAAAGAIIVSVANHLGDIISPQPQPGAPAAVNASHSELQELTQMVYGPARNRLGTGCRRPNTTSLRNKMENIRAVLDELEDNGIQAQPTPSGGRSRLLRCRPHLGSYS